MFIKISFPTSWKDSMDIKPNSINVCVKLENRYDYTMTVATLKNVEFLMNQTGKSYYGPANPLVLVKELTKQSVEEAIKDYAENTGYYYGQSKGYWLKIYHWAANIDEIIFSQLKIKEMYYFNESNEVNLAMIAKPIADIPIPKVFEIRGPTGNRTYLNPTGMDKPDILEISSKKNQKLVIKKLKAVYKVYK